MDNPETNSTELPIYTFDITTIESLLNEIKTNNQSYQEELVSLQTQLIAINTHTRELQSYITVGIGLALALAISYKLIKIFF